MAFVLSTAYRDNILDFYKEQFGTSLRLFKLPTSGEPSRTMAYADFTEADFSGYAAQTTAYQNAVLDSDAAYSFSDTELFQHDSQATDNDIYGAIGYVDADEIAASELATHPQTIDDCGDAILLRLKIWLKDSGSGTWMFCNELMKRIVAAFKPDHCYLFKNDYTPAADSVIGNYTECDFPGYASNAIHCWGNAALNGNTAYIESCVLQWTATGDSDPSQAAYGYYLTDGGVYVGGQRFASPIDMSDSNDTMAMQVKLNLSNPVT